jgi:hypothetical protein
LAEQGTRLKGRRGHRFLSVRDRRENAQQTKSLAVLRDDQEPRLLSGEIRVEDGETAVEAKT